MIPWTDTYSSKRHALMSYGKKAIGQDVWLAPIYRTHQCLTFAQREDVVVTRNNGPTVSEERFWPISSPWCSFQICMGFAFCCILFCGVIEWGCEGRRSAGKIIWSSLESQCCHVWVSVAAIRLYPCLVPLSHSRTSHAIDFPEVLMWEGTAGQNKNKGRYTVRKVDK